MIKEYKGFLLTKIFGFRVETEFDFDDYPKCIYAVVPHTNWKDVPLGLMVRRLIKQDIGFIAKQSLFKPPFGKLFYWLGGRPIDRSGGKKQVDAVVELFNKSKEMKIAIAPEGTRQRVEKLKSGFYHMAKLSNVPICLVKFDVEEKLVYFKKPFYATEKDKDFEMINAFYKNVKGFIAEYSFNVDHDKR